VQNVNTNWSIFPICGCSIRRSQNLSRRMNYHEASTHCMQQAFLIPRKAPSLSKQYPGCKLLASGYLVCPKSRRYDTYKSKVSSITFFSKKDEFTHGTRAHRYFWGVKPVEFQISQSGLGTHGPPKLGGAPMGAFSHWLREFPQKSNADSHDFLLTGETPK